MYLLLIWGYMSLKTPQWFAVFTALLMSGMLLFWVGDAAEAAREQLRLYKKKQAGARQGSAAVAGNPSLDVSMEKLDALKSELMQQYAEFGKDQSALNSKILGSWHRTRDPNRHRR